MPCVGLVVVLVVVVVACVRACVRAWGISLGKDGNRNAYMEDVQVRFGPITRHTHTHTHTHTHRTRVLPSREATREKNTKKKPRSIVTCSMSLVVAMDLICW